MAIISYPITLPVAPSEYSVKDVSIVAQTASIFTGQQYTYKHQGEWLEVSMQFSIGDKETRGALIAALSSLRGKYGTFYFEPKGKDAISRGAPAGSPVVTALQNDNELVTAGWTSSITNVVKAGDYIQVGTASPRLFRVLADANSDGSGNATIAVFPSYRNVVTISSPIVYTNPKGIFRLTGDWNYTLGVGSTISGISLTAREVL